MISLQDLEKEYEVIEDSPVSLGKKRKSSTGEQQPKYKWHSSVAGLVSFHFSVLPFFESKQESDSFLMLDSHSEDSDSVKMTPNVVVSIQEDGERAQKLDSVFVKVIFPFIERRIDEEGVWRKSANFSRIKRLQKELVILTNGSNKAKTTETVKNLGSTASVNHSRMSITSTSSHKSKKKNASCSSMGSLASSSSLSASRSSLDEIDDDNENCEYSVHDMTTLVKRILLPALQDSKEVTAFLSLVHYLATLIPSNFLAREPVLLKDDAPRIYTNILSCMSLYLLFHQKDCHDIFTECQHQNHETETNMMSLFVYLFDLLKYTTLHSTENKMTSSSIATLFLPHLYPEEHETMDSKESEKSKQNHYILSFMIEFWPQIRSHSALPATFMTDFEKNQVDKKSKSNSSSDASSFKNESADEDDDQVLKTCVRFCTTAQTPKPETGGIGDTELELARMYAHVQSTQNKKMIKKLNRAGVVVPPSSTKKSKLNPVTPGSATPSSSKTPLKISSSLRALFSSAKKKSTKKRLLGGCDSPSSYDLTEEKEATNTSASTTSHSFEVLRFS